ncbi:MAG: trehalose-phosphatase [Dehalococcoidia bacterium]|nr:trehalose-phosphatase [Dehalococcoidia bacterium]
MAPLLERRPLGLISDIDGTLAPIVPDPEDARVAESTLVLLRQLTEKGVRLAFITGRTLEKARSMAGVEGAAFAANHGLNIWVDGALETPDGLGEYVPRAQDVLREIGTLDVAGVSVEDKGPVLAFHYRKALSEAAARQAILAAIQASQTARAFRLQEGRKVIEVRPPLLIDKGTALAYLARRLGLAAVICMGDDATDIDMFRGVRELRAAGLAGVSIAVASAEASPGVLAGADYWLPGVAGVEWLLGGLLKALPG